MANLVDARSWVVDNLVVNSSLILAPGSVTVGAVVETALTVATLTFTTAVSQIIPGATSFSIRNNANTLDNLLVLDNGNTSVQGVLTAASGVNISNSTDLTLIGGNLVFTAAASRIVPGATSLSLRNSANSADNLLVGNTGNVTVRTSLTLGAELFFTASAARIVGGGTSLSLRNTGNTADNLLITDAGIIALRGSLTTGASAGDLVVSYNQGLRGVNNAGSTTNSIIYQGTAGAFTDTVIIASANQNIFWGATQIANGGGAAPTFGTIGGSGPTAAAQSGWFKVINSASAARYFPVWA